MSSSISSLPPDLVSEILALVGASSSTDLFRAKLCCKVFKEVSEEKYIYQRVSLDKFAIRPWYKKNKKVSNFLKMCRQNKNAEALYRKGVVNYFRGKNPDRAFKCIREAAESGHDGAVYALGIVCLFGKGEVKEKGMTLLSAMKRSKVQKRRVKKCREDLKRILRMLWIGNSFHSSERPICCDTHHKRQRGWPVDEIDEEEYVCEGCSCEEEIAPICDTLGLRIA